MYVCVYVFVYEIDRKRGEKGSATYEDIKTSESRKLKKKNGMSNE